MDYLERKAVVEVGHAMVLQAPAGLVHAVDPPAVRVTVTRSPPMTPLTHMRWVAAFAVALSHYRNLLMLDYSPGGAVKGVFYYISGFGHAGVVVFFVLSGFLVGGKIRSMASDPSPDLRRYLLDRSARIFVVVWPAIALSLAVLFAITRLWPDSPIVLSGHWSSALAAPLADDLSPARWFGLSALLNGLITPTPAVNGPLWSLACEWAYYMAAAAGVALFRRQWSLLIPYAVLLVGLAALNNREVLAGGVVWVLGALAGSLSDRALIRGRAALVALSGLALGVLGASRVLPLPDIVLGAAVALAISHRAWRSWTAPSRIGTALADFSYTLYATHFPLAVLMAATLGRRLAYGPAGLLVTMLGLVAALGCAWLLAGLTEKRTAEVRRWLDAATRPRIATPVASL